MLVDNLTIKQEKFAQNLFAGMSQRDAYKQAYNASNMTDKSADEESCKLANSPKITSRIEQLTIELKERNMATVENVIKEFAHIAFDDIKNYLSYKTALTVVGKDKQTGEDIIDYKTVVDLKDSDTIDTRNISEISTGPNGVFRFKQYCKDNALDKLAKILGMYQDNVKLTGGLGNTNVNINIDDPEAAKQRLRELWAKSGMTEEEIDRMLDGM